MARVFFNAYHSYLDAMELLDDAERGRLFTACLIYSKTGEAPPLPGNEKFLFNSIKSQIDRDKKKYDQICETRRRSISKRWKETATE